jgi:cytochrome c oxidase cbb3-type subunit 4
MTVLSFATFMGIALWAYSGKAKESFDEAARLPFAEDEAAAESARETRQ